VRLHQVVMATQKVWR